MGRMFAQFFSFITTLFSAAEKLAKAGDHLATWSEESAGTFADEARIQRKARHIAMLKEFDLTEQ